VLSSWKEVTSEASLLLAFALTIVSRRSYVLY
jgi:hypothetical protein